MSSKKMIPPQELERWNQASEIEPGIRSIKIQLIHTLTVTMDFAAFTEEVEERLDRWRQGEYTLKEAAQVMSEAYPKINATTFCRQIEKAIRAGKLILRENGNSIAQEDLPDRALATRIIEARDLNDWLEEEKNPARLTYPYDEQQPGSEVAQTQAASAHSNESLGAGDAIAIRANREAALADQPRGSKGLILEHWDKVEARYGPAANGTQVRRVLCQFLDGTDRVPDLKTIQNHLPQLRKGKLIP